MPEIGFAFGGFAGYLLDVHFFRRSFCYKRVAAVAATGYIIGGIGSYRVRNSLKRPLEYDILTAFQHKYVDTVINTSGRGSSYTSLADHTEEMTKKKPYY